MTGTHANNYPKLHNAAWPGVVGKGPGGEPAIDLDTMLDLTADAEVEGVRFDGVDLFLFEPHVNIDAGDDQLKALADKVRRRNLEIGSVVAPVWPPTGGGMAMGDAGRRKRFLTQVEKACRIAQRLRELEVRPTASCGSIRRAAWRPGAKTPRATNGESPRRLARRARSPRTMTSDWPPKGKSAGGACKLAPMIELLEMVDRPQTLGFQADMAHTLLYLLGYNAPKDVLLPQDFDWNDRARFDEAYQTLVASLCGRGRSTSTSPRTTPRSTARARTTKPAGTAWPTIPTASSTSPSTPAIGSATRTAADENIRHICWDGCMFPNAVMMKRQTWNDILAAMIGVRDVHGWRE